MTCRNKTDKAHVPASLLQNLINVQYDKKYKRDESPGPWYIYKLNKFVHPNVVDPSAYVVLPNETVKTYIPLLLDEPGNPFRIIKKDEFNENKKNKTNFKFRTKKLRKN